MATLTGQRIKDSYKDLLQVSNSNSGIDSTLRVISDGEATDSVLQISTTAVNISSAGALQYAGVAITSTAAELNILDGATVTVAELNILDGVTASATDINLIDGITNGTVIASKAIITDSNKDITGGRNITISGELDAATLDISGDADIDGTLETDALTIGGVTSVPFEAADHSKLDGIEASATADQSNAEIVAAVEAGSDSNTFTDADHSKLNAIEASADVTDTANVTSSGALMDSELASIADIKALDQSVVSGATPTFTTTNFTDASNKRLMTDAQETKLDSVESNATADQTDEEIQDVVGAMFSSNTETGITATYQDGDGTIDLVVGTLNQDTTGTASKATVTDSTANTNFPVVFHDEGTGNVLLDDTGALRYNPSTGELLVPKLTVAGTTTQVDTVTMEAANAIKFEGATADANETILSIVDPTNDDNTQYLLNASGYIPLLNAVSTTVITATPAELNYVDGVTSNIQTQLDATLDTAGALIDLSSTTINVDLTEAGEAAIANGDYILFLDGGATGTHAKEAIADVATLFAGAGMTATSSVINVIAGTGIDVAADAISVDVSDFMSNGSNNRILTATGTDAMNAEANLTFDGSHLRLPNNSSVIMGASDAFVINHNGSHNYIQNTKSDADFYFTVNDGGSTINALIIDSSEVANIVLPNDNQRLLIGEGNDLQLLHNGTNSYIANYVGDLIIENHEADKDIILYNDDGSGGTTPYLTLDGSATKTIFAQSTQHADNAKATFGAAGDMEISHNGTHNFIDLDNGNLYFRDDADNNILIVYREGGGVQLAEGDLKIPATSKLYFDGGSHTYIYEQAADTLDFVVGGTQMINIVEGSTNYVRLPDSALLAVGGSLDLYQVHDGTNSKIQNNTGTLSIVQNTTDSDLILSCDDGSGGTTAYITLDGSAVGINMAKFTSFSSSISFPASHSADKIQMYSGGNEKIGTEANTLLFTADNYKFKDVAGHDNLFMNNSGNVGIGTTSPGVKLDVAGQARTTNGMLVDNGTTAGFFTTDSDNVNFGASTSGKGLKLFSANAERMRINSSGCIKVGPNGGDTAHTFEIDTSGNANHGLFVNADEARGAGDYALYVDDEDPNARGTVRIDSATGTAVDINCASGYLALDVSTPLDNVAKFTSTDASAAIVIQDSNSTDNFNRLQVVTNDMLFVTNNSEKFRIAANGDLTATDTSIASNSDLRLKKNIENFEGGLDIISKLQPRNFEWRNPEIHKEGTRRGFIAQEVKEVDEYWINTLKIQEENKDYEYVKDTEGQSFVSKLSDKDAMYVSAIQELKREIDELKLKLGEKNG